MVLSDPDGHCVAANHAFCEMVGYAEQELLGKLFQSVTHPDDLEANPSYARQLITGEIQSFTFEKCCRHKNGYSVWALLTASLARDAQDRPLYVISQVQDIDSRTSLRRSLLGSGQLLFVEKCLGN